MTGSCPRANIRLEADRVIQRIRATQSEDPDGSVAILVRARSHLLAITEALKAAGSPVQCSGYRSLADRAIYAICSL